MKEGIRCGFDLLGHARYWSGILAEKSIAIDRSLVRIYTAVPVVVAQNTQIPRSLIPGSTSLLSEDSTG